jgi:tetratricopeptide (TPR) repeat protein
MRKLVFLMCAFFSTELLNAQVLDEEIGFRYVKAEYLLTTDRFEDAIRELNEVVKQNSGYKNALLLRAETKYRLAAYKGAKADVLEYINLNGITGKAASILGRSEYALNAHDDVIFNSVNAAIVLGEKEVKLYEIRAQIYENRNQKLSACEDWQTAARMGSTNGAIKSKRLCGVTDSPSTQEQKPSNPSSTDEPRKDNTTKVDTSKVTQGEVLKMGNKAEDTTLVQVVLAKPDSANTIPDVRIPEEDNTKNTIVIDEELKLEIYGQGLGKRTVKERPNILILAEKDGVVTVEICVNERGIVTSAEFVGNKSTLNQNSLVSLAIRKAREFWFADGEYPKQCGFISFVIKGS